MNINQLILTIKEKITKNICVEKLEIEDKSFLHKKHKTHQEGKFHLKLTIKSDELKSTNKIKATKKIYMILKDELKQHIHSVQILIN